VYYEFKELTCAPAHCQQNLHLLEQKWQQHYFKIINIAFVNQATPSFTYIGFAAKGKYTNRATCVILCLI
jgi:hypothetical protein